MKETRFQSTLLARCWWNTPVIPATQEAEIRGLWLEASPVRPYLEKYPSQKRAGGVAQGVGPEFKPRYCEKKKKHFIIWSVLD
jgi:hypothetical protein